MEEILASIRRIIEDSEPGSTKPQQEMAAQDWDNEDEGPAGGEGSVIEVQAFRDGLGREEADKAQPARTAPEVKPEVRPSMSDIKASLNAIDAVQAHEPAKTPESVRRDVPAEPTRQAPSPSYAGVNGAHAAPASEATSADKKTVEEPAADAPSELRPSIISEQAGRQVAAAFGELSEVFAASRRRSFDEMAEEMIRPMLREWMDNNLPVLVERLVREEIERVARGA